MAFVSKGTKGQRATKDVSIPSLGGDVRLRSMTAGRQFEIEKLFPTTAEGRLADVPGYMRAMVAETATDEAGAPLWTPDELKEMDRPAFWELWDAVSEYLGLDRGASAKN